MARSMVGMDIPRVGMHAIVCLQDQNDLIYWIILIFSSTLLVESMLDVRPQFGFLGLAVLETSGSRVLMDDRINCVAPKGVRVVHHQRDDHGNELAQKTSAITQLVTVDLAIPRRTTVD